MFGALTNLDLEDTGRLVAVAEVVLDNPGWHAHLEARGFGGLDEHLVKPACPLIDGRKAAKGKSGTGSR